MTLVAPVGLWFLLALPAIFILYLIQSRYRPRVVASLVLWKRMPRDLEAEAAWRRPRWDVLLALQLLVALFAALALARPAVSGGGPQHLVLVLDTSASMSARDVQPTRFSAARQQVARVLSTTTPDTRVTFVSAGARPRVVVDDGSPANVLGAMDALQIEPNGGDMASALRLAAGLAAPNAGAGSQVVAVTDGAHELSLPPQAVPVSFKLVGGSGGNLAVSEVSVRRPVDRADYLAGFVRVVNFGTDPLSTAITILADSLPVDRSPLQVPGSGHAEATFRVPANAHSMSVVLSDHDPAFPAGDRIDLPGYARWARRVTIVSETPTLWEHVLSGVPDLTTRSIRPPDFEPAAVGPDDITLFDNVAPADLPKSGLILVNPPDTSPLLTRVDLIQRQRRAEQFDPEDPLLAGLDIGPLNVQQMERAVAPAWAASSVDAQDTPLIVHGRLGDQRAVIFAFDPARSNLPHLAAFPLLLANAVDWLTPGRVAVLRAGLGDETSIQPRPVADVAATSEAAPVPSLSDQWPWFVAAAGVLFLFEWVVAVRRG
jgi:Ca-activated chloride channel homolog